MTIGNDAGMRPSLAQPPGTLRLPRAWQPLAPFGTDPHEWTDVYLAELGLDDPTAARLRHGLLAVMGMAAGMRGGERHNYAFIEDPATGSVRALLSVQMLTVKPGDFEDYRARVEAARRMESVETINQTVEEKSLPAGRALIVHDFVVRAEEQAVPDPALERAILALFVESRGVLIEFGLYAQDLLLFEDMTEYLIELVGTLVPTTEAP